MLPPRLHAALDAVSAAALLLNAAAARRTPIQGPLGIVGMAVAGYSLATRYSDSLGAGRPIPMHAHRLLDAAQGAACLALARSAESLVERNVLRSYGAFSLAVAAVSSPPGPPGVGVPKEGVHSSRRLGAEVAYLRCGIVNVAFIGAEGAGDREWFLVDAGLAGSAAAIRDAARKRFGRARPAAILLTHGHFDHVGALQLLAREWDAPIYAHPAEHPYLTGQQSYAPAAPEVGGGAMAELSWLFPRGPIDVSAHLRELPADGRIPGLEAWQWIHTPGHTPGHVSFWNEGSRTLVAGDAIVTTQQESMLRALFPQGRLHGPPAYFTPDWQAAHHSVQRLADLRPQIVVSGHGPALQGPDVCTCLEELASDFSSRGLPACSRYLNDRT